MPFAQERYPQYVDELIGISEGANVSLDELAGCQRDGSGHHGCAASIKMHQHGSK